MKFKIPGLKKIDVLLMRSYVGPFAVTFFFVDVPVFDAVPLEIYR